MANDSKTIYLCFCYLVPTGLLWAAKQTSDIVERLNKLGYLKTFKITINYFVRRSRFQNRHDTYNDYLEDPEVLNNEWLNMLHLQQVTNGNGSE